MLTSWYSSSEFVETVDDVDTIARSVVLSDALAVSLVSQGMSPQMNRYHIPTSTLQKFQKIHCAIQREDASANTTIRLKETRLTLCFLVTIPPHLAVYVKNCQPHMVIFTKIKFVNHVKLYHQKTSIYILLTLYCNISVLYFYFFI